MINMSFNLNRNIVAALRQGAVELDTLVSLYSAANKVYLHLEEPLFVRINSKMVSKEKISEICIGEICNNNISISDEYKSGYRKVIEISDKCWEDKKNNAKKNSTVAYANVNWNL